MAQAVIIDTEATDKDPKTSQVIELAEYRISQTPRQFASAELPFLTSASLSARPSNWLFGHTTPIKFGALAAHHILPEELEGQPLFDGYMMPPFCDYIIGHNIDFDAELIKLDQAVRRICTLALARFLIPECDAHNQSALLYYIGAAQDGIVDQKTGLAWARDRLKNAHRASDDVENCAILLRVLLRLMEKVAPSALDSWEDVWLFSEEARIPRVMGFGKHKGEPVESVPMGYIKWYLGTPDQDPMLLKAWRRAGLIR